ncbi:5-(carboxyamino)imidazole ribonucleotide synthase [Wenzhouxiangella sp. AB-CW3]|uniref:5-(carboxyamino)imidazole ribonucleotide synthase n=1 Tax=Wenzhouxiangella sp. AB-CW3 TaxID=2771012 RepID=UPI00168ADE5B|nr:5-(carboxyamino)imidazole ribonucleotide synthase [Wenzhouxiangella sp. AB-CW3]QOC21508.1 5-(carboxyamino)imidazole ribonucleotide synthase [Wenzhouxiangella sp. AB-CW3]
MKVGILGGGQLARMLAQAGLPLGLDFTIVDPKADACAGALGRRITAQWDDDAAVEALAACDRVTCDFENVPAKVLDALTGRTTVHPSARALAAGQDRLHEKRMFESLDIPVPSYAAVSSRPDLAEAVARIGFPAVLKTRRMGYDGKGQAVLRSDEDLEPAWQTLGGQDLILEGFVPFDFECAITVVRSASGEIRCYPLSRTVHRDGILQLALAPAPGHEDLQARAETMGRALADHLDYVGCLTLELFAVEGQLLANEFAPRVHNSAHWTIEGAQVSQFENHLRAVCGWPLGSTAARGQSLMINWIGQMPARERLLACAGLHWHDYGKSARAGRKVGHATLTEADGQGLETLMGALRPALDDQLALLLGGLMKDSA